MLLLIASERILKIVVSFIWTLTFLYMNKCLYLFLMYVLIFPMCTVSAGLSAVFLKSFLPWQVSMTLLPVMGGVALASLNELSFSWLSFISAMVSNVASASRGESVSELESCGCVSVCVCLGIGVI